MDYMYKHFTGKSVHLADWPKEKTSRIDSKLTNDLRQVRSIIEGIRRIREKNNTGLRQPLPYANIAGIGKDTIELYKGLIKGQVNVKEINSHKSPEEFAKISARLDVKQLGPVLKKDLQSVSKAVAEGKFKQLDTGELEVEGHKIDPSHYSVEWLPENEKEDTWNNSEIVISVSFNITEELRIEGVSKNLNRIIQDLRKELKLPYDNRIDLNIEADGEWKKAVNAHREWLIEQTLTLNLSDKVTKCLYEKEDENGSLKIEIIPK